MRSSLLCGLTYLTSFWLHLCPFIFLHSPPTPHQGEDLSELKAVVHGIILGMEVPFKLPNDDGCKDSGLECPLTKDTSYRYSTTLPVLKQYPKVRNLLMKRFFLRSRGGNLQTKSFPAAKCALIARIIISFNGFFPSPNQILSSSGTCSFA